MMIKIITGFLIFVVILPVYAGDIIDLCGEWRLSPLTVVGPNVKSGDEVEDKLNYAASDFNDNSWEKINVPHNWSLQYDRNHPMTSKNKIGWYRRTAYIPKEWEQGRVILHFDGVDWEAIVFINGERVGKHQGSYTTFEFDITDKVIQGRENSIVAKVYDYYTKERYDHAPWRVGGIWDRVWLENRGRRYTSNVLITPNINKSEISVDFSIENPSQSTEKLDFMAEVMPVNDDNKITGKNTEMAMVQPGKTDLNFKVKLENPVYWCPENPYLYNLRIRLKDKDGKIIDEKNTRFGFREFIAKDKKFLLNGREYHLFGGHMYECSYGEYKAVGDIKNVEKTIKELIKSGHRITRILPRMPKETFELADKYGLMLYNQWDYIGDKDINSGVFKSNVSDMMTWIKDMYNHPSVVMWIFSNETWYDKYVENQNKTYEILRSIDKQNRPMSATCGQYTNIGSPSLPVKNDFIDLHPYIGLASPVLCTAVSKMGWVSIPDYVNDNIKRIDAIYGRQMDFPIIIGECPGGNFPVWAKPIVFPIDKKISIDEYIKIISSRATPGYPISYYAGKLAGIRRTTLPDKKGIGLIGNDLTKKIVEEFRRIPVISGVFPWGNLATEVAEIVYQPLLVCSDVVYNHSYISGNNLSNKLYLINNSVREYDDLRITANIVAYGSEKRINVHKRELTLKHSGINTIEEITEEIVLPSEIETGKYQIVYEVINKEGIVSTNKYNVYVLSRKETEIEINNRENVALYEGKFMDNKDIEITKKILNKLKVKYEAIRETDNLGKYKKFIMPINNRKDVWINAEGILKIGKDIRVWMEAGGEMLCLEQSLTGPLPWVKEINTVEFERPPVLMDPVAEKHPVYKGLDVDNFNVWSGKNGIICKTGIMPLSVNLLGGVMDFLTDVPMMGLIEAKIGKGRYIMSQVLSVERYGTDASATKYLNNLINYFIGDEKVNDTLGLVGETPIAKVNKGNISYIDLRPYCNMGFADEVSGDLKGGWTDQGPTNDIRELPVGEQDFLGVPFDIINPEKNNGNSCLVLGKKVIPWTAQMISGIKIEKKVKRLFFLHTTAFEVDGGKYIFNYEDGTKEEVKLEKDRQISGWWNPTNLKEARVAWKGKNPRAGVVGFYLWLWNNPHPEKRLKSIDMLCINDECVFILLGISAENNE